ncbi:MAG: hypothetical protein C4K49_07740 [Candidatus Thorarchaeota archaeon]|nr:MAG: hypothetical protein C4K49_07740 [Candidatus Thorarchaeota archaeon]
MVPVLSVQMTVTLPNVSTADNLLTSTFCRAICRELIASAEDTVSCRPSGTSETITPIMRKIPL